MNIEAYNLDSLRKLVRSLQDENRRLKEQLNKADIAYESEDFFEEKLETMEEYDPDQGERIQYKYITEELAIGVYPLFPDGTCRFLVFDFDNHEKGAEKTDFANTSDEWHEEVDALRGLRENLLDSCKEA